MRPADDLVALAGECARDPYRFVMAAFPWGEPGDLVNDKGPRQWQREVLQEIGERLRAGYAPGAALMPVLKAVATGHGVGKSALIAMIALWALTTCPDAKVMLTANTEQQVRTKTWPEITLWSRRSIFSHWFTVTGTAIHSVDEAHVRTWRLDAVTWSENNLEAFAGLHNRGKRVVLLFDEASGIGDKVWDVAEGALTDEDTEIVWIAAGNPTQPVGRFFECLNRQLARWRGRKIDARTVEGTNKAQFAEWVAFYGEDSDFVRVRVRGEFPNAGTMQFIGRDVVAEARKRVVQTSPSEALIIGVDVARFGADRSVIAFRRGRDAASISAHVFNHLDTMQLAAQVNHLYYEHNADGVFIDGGGVGGGVIDRCRQLGLSVFDVQFGGAPTGFTGMGDERYECANRRTEMWANMRAWLPYGAILDSDELAADLTGPQYSYAIRQGRDVIMLERKQDMAVRGLRSSDLGDALALTFAGPVTSRNASRRRGRGMKSDYDPFADFAIDQDERYRRDNAWRG